MTAPIALALTINGEAHELTAHPHETLLEVLRSRLGLTGTKENCLEAECGVCTVLLDGLAVNACILLAAQCQGRRVTTVEGLAGPEGGLHPLQEAFKARGAVQCGYCIPGMLLAARALLDADPDPTEAAIREALAGNLCRCTGYQKIVEAVQDAARVMAGAR
jgi:carbon-monoxide dehydrogenase small subunit